jgi:hypothetical protein
MSPLATSLIVFMFVFGGALVGLALQRRLPQHHLNAESRTVLTMAQGIVGTIVAIVLGLLIASAYASFDVQRKELTELSAKIVLLDRILAQYGPETKEARDLLRGTIVYALDRVWGEKVSTASESQLKTAGGQQLYEKILELSPNDDTRRTLKTQAVNIGLELARTRALMGAQESTSISPPLLIMVVFWLTIILTSFGLFAPNNATVVSALFFTALSVSGAVFLLLELYEPFQGVIHLSSTPLRNALANLGR